MDNRFRAKIIASLRKLSYQWEPRKMALDRAKKRTLVGHFKNGNPKFVNLYQCASCACQFKSNEVHVDHIVPVVDPAKGFEDWNEYMSRLFCDLDNLQVLCKPCHKEKTKKENA